MTMVIRVAQLHTRAVSPFDDVAVERMYRRKTEDLQRRVVRSQHVVNLDRQAEHCAEQKHA